MDCLYWFWAELSLLTVFGFSTPPIPDYNFFSRGSDLLTLVDLPEVLSYGFFLIRAVSLFTVRDALSGMMSFVPPYRVTEPFPQSMCPLAIWKMTPPFSDRSRDCSHREVRWRASFSPPPFQSYTNQICGRRFAPPRLHFCV